MAAREYLLEHPDATRKQLATAIGCSDSLVCRLPAWRAVSAQRRERQARKSPKVGSFTRKLEATVVGDGSVLDKLIAKQGDDYEPSPLEDDPKHPDGRPIHKVRVDRKL